VRRDVLRGNRRRSGTPLSLAGAVVTLTLAAVPTSAQLPAQCALPVFQPYPSVLPACTLVLDAATAFQPVLGAIVSGGNPVAGTAGALGGLGRLTVSARLSLIGGSLPDLGVTGQFPVPTRFSGVVPASQVDAAVGLFRGLRDGILAVDALGAVVGVPIGAVSDLWALPGDAHVGGFLLGFGYGARIGLGNGRAAIPALSLSYMRRSLPRLQYGNPPSATDVVAFDMDLRADNYRVEAGWRLGLLDLATGAGVDHYVSALRLRGQTATSAFWVSPFDLTATRRVLFLDAGVRLAPARLVSELGYQTGSNQRVFTTFSDINPHAGHLFGGVGLQFAW
jgi:hypothetical protein